MKPPVSDDVKTLFRRFGGEASTYKEVNQEQHNKHVESKWPMLMSIDPDRALVVPSVKRAVRISEVRHEVADFDGTERRMAVAVPSESSFQKKPGGRRENDTALVPPTIPSASALRAAPPAIPLAAEARQQFQPNNAPVTSPASSPDAGGTQPPTRKTRATASTRKPKTTAIEKPLSAAVPGTAPTPSSSNAKPAQPNSLLSLFGRIKQPAEAAPAPAEPKGLFKRRAS
jgi:hypothetical protein